MKKAVAVTIAGQRISLKSDADESYVQLLADYVDEKIRDLQPRAQRAGAHELAMLAALRIADDLFCERRQRAELRQAVRRQAEQMLDEIAALGENPTRT